MQVYIVFGWIDCYPSGGPNDIVASFDSQKLAEDYVGKHSHEENNKDYACLGERNGKQSFCQMEIFEVSPDRVGVVKRVRHRMELAL